MPDIITVAKHFGGGVGVSAVITTAAIEDKVIASGYAATHSHANDPLICAAGVASLDVIAHEDVPAKARKIGDHMRERLEALAAALRDDRRCPRTRPAHGHRACARPVHQGAGDRRGPGDRETLLRQRPDLLAFAAKAACSASCRRRPATEGQIDAAMDVLGRRSRLSRRDSESLSRLVSRAT